MPRIKFIPWGVILRMDAGGEMTVRIWSAPGDPDAAMRGAEDIYGGAAIAAQANVPPLA